MTKFITASAAALIGLTCSELNEASAQVGEAETVMIALQALNQTFSMLQSPEPDMDVVYGQANYTLLLGVHDRLDHVENIVAKTLLDVSNFPEMNRRNIARGLKRRDIDNLYGLHTQLVEIWLADGSLSEKELLDFQSRFNDLGAKMDGVAHSKYIALDAMPAMIHAIIELFHSQQFENENYSELVSKHRSLLESLLDPTREQSITFMKGQVEAAIERVETELGLQDIEGSTGKWLGTVDYATYRWNFLCGSFDTIRGYNCSGGARAYYYKNNSRSVLPVIFYERSIENGIRQLKSVDCTEEHESSIVIPKAPIVKIEPSEKNLGCYREYEYGSLTQWQEELFKPEVRYKVGQANEGFFSQGGNPFYARRDAASLSKPTTSGPALTPIEDGFGEQSDLYGRLPLTSFSAKIKSAYNESELLASTLNELYQAHAALDALELNVQRFLESLSSLDASEALARASEWQKSYPALEDVLLFGERENIEQNRQLIAKMHKTRARVLEEREEVERSVHEALETIRKNQPAKRMQDNLRVIGLAYDFSSSILAVAAAQKSENVVQSSTANEQQASVELTNGDELAASIQAQMSSQGVEISLEQAGAFAEAERSVSSLELAFVPADPAMEEYRKVRKQINLLQEKRLAGYKDLPLEGMADYEADAMNTIRRLANLPLSRAESTFQESHDQFTEQLGDAVIAATPQGAFWKTIMASRPLAPGEIMGAEHRATLIKSLANELAAMQTFRGMQSNDLPEYKLFLDALPKGSEFKPAP